MNTVYVIQDPDGKEIESARQYGQLRVMLSGRECPEVASTKLHQALKDFKPNDFLLMLGRSVNMALAFHYATLAINGNPIQVLLWEREEYRYHIYHITPKLHTIHDLTPDTAAHS